MPDSTAINDFGAISTFRRIAARKSYSQRPMKIRFSTWLLVAGIGLANLASAAEESAFGFKADTLGSTLAAFVRRHEVMIRQKPEAAGFGPAFTVRIARANPGQIVAERIQVSSDRSTIGSFGDDTIAGAPCSVRFAFFTDNTANVERALAREREARRRQWTTAESLAAESLLLGLVRIEFEQSQFQKVRDALEGKYGKPANESQQPVQNRLGATFGSQRTIWQKGGDLLVAIERDGSIDKSSVTMSRASVTALTAALDQQAKGAASKDL